MSFDCEFNHVYSLETEQKIAQEFQRLKDVCYLDHTGSTIYGLSQIQAIMHDLLGNIYGNPHSLSMNSKYTADVVDQVRYQVLKHFNTSPVDYSIVFTSGATESLRIVAECFDWLNANSNEGNADLQTNDEDFGNGDAKHIGQAGTFTYLQDNHTSVLGMREVAAGKGARIQCLSHDDAIRYFSECEDLGTEAKNKEICYGNSLFVYPAQCNFSGLKYPLSWIKKVHDGVLNCDKTMNKSKWFCFLDAATYVSTNCLDLTEVQPDFVCLSFYKIFGYPTGLGALLVKSSSAHSLKKTYFGGGTVLISLSAERFHVPRMVLHDKLEDGTISFLSIISLRHSFCALRRLTSDMSTISRHTFSLARYVHHILVSIHHGNGSPVAMVYCDTDYEDLETQGNIVNFNLLRPDGEHVGFVEVLNMANLHNIQLRTGCFCNPGACQRHLKLSAADLRSHFQAGHVCGDDKDLINGRPTGSVRISFGYMSTKADADQFLAMIRSCFVQGVPIYKVPDWWSSFCKTYCLKFRRKSAETENIVDVKVSVNDEHVDSVKGDSASKVKSETKKVNQNNGVFLSRIFIYPVKSCGAMSVKKWTIGRKGLLYDREWMIVTPAGVSLTQKQNPRLCLISPKINVHLENLELNFPGLAPLVVPLGMSECDAEPDFESSLCQSKVCGDRIQGWDCGDEAADWLCEALERDGLRLIRQWDLDQRSLKLKNKEEGGQKSALSLSNQAQYLLINTASVDWLLERLTKCENYDRDNLLQRFRSNLVIEGGDAFSENSWRGLRIGSNHFRSEGPCTRCQMVCIDQSTGEKTREPLQTLAAAFQGKMRFGVYLSHDQTSVESEIETSYEVHPDVDAIS